MNIANVSISRLFQPQIWKTSLSCYWSRLSSPGIGHLDLKVFRRFGGLGRLNHREEVSLNPQLVIANFQILSWWWYSRSSSPSSSGTLLINPTVWPRTRSTAWNNSRVKWPQERLNSEVPCPCNRCKMSRRIPPSEAANKRYPCWLATLNHHLKPPISSHKYWGDQWRSSSLTIYMQL